MYNALVQLYSNHEKRDNWSLFVLVFYTGPGIDIHVFVFPHEEKFYSKCVLTGLQQEIVIWKIGIQYLIYFLMNPVLHDENESYNSFVYFNL